MAENYSTDYAEGYAQGITDYFNAISDFDFLKYNYGINDIDVQFICMFNPIDVIKDYEEYKNEQKAMQ